MNVMRRRLKEVSLVIMTIVVVAAFMPGNAYAASISLKVQTHSQSEIKSRIIGSGVNINDKVTYTVNPNAKKPYNIGELSDSTLKSGLAMLNNIRYVAGLNDVKLDSEFNEKAQAAAFISGVNGKLEHIDPKRPSGMSDELYDLCSSGTSSTNLGLGYSTLNEVILSWSDDSGIESLGHRRWVLNPAMGKTGLGYAFSGSAMYAFDESGSGSQSYVAWPAQQMPIDYMVVPEDGVYYPEGDAFVWSISTGKYESKEDIQVVLTRKSDSKTWIFNDGSDQDSSGSGYFNVNNEGYGMSGCIMFEPNRIWYHSGDVYHVKITGASAGTIEYDVNIFSLIPVSSVKFPTLPDKIDVEDTIDAEAIIKPDNSSERTAEYKSSDPNVISIGDTGFIEAKNAGIATITAVSGGKSDSKTITVQKRKIDDTSFIFRKVKSSYVYTGKSIKPVPKVTLLKSIFDDEITLKNGKDYKLSYGANKKIGKGYVDVTGIGNYKGKWRIGFDIRPGQVKKYSVKTGKKKVTVKFTKVKGASKYQIRIKQKGEKTRTVTTKGNKTIKKLKSKKAVVKIRAYKKVGSKKYFGKWSKTKEVSIK